MLVLSCSDERKKEAAKLEEQLMQQDAPKPESLATLSPVEIDSIKAVSESAFVAARKAEEKPASVSPTPQKAVEPQTQSKAEASAAKPAQPVVRDQPNTEPESKAATKPSEPSMPPHPAGDRYTVQIGSTVSQAEADAQVALYVSRGYEAYISTVTMDGRDRYRVRIGKFATRKEAVVLSAELHTKFAIEGWVDKISE